MHEKKVTETKRFGNFKKRSRRIEFLNVAPAKPRNALQSVINSLYFFAMAWLTSTRQDFSFPARAAATPRGESCVCCMPVGTGPAET
jgi:hypothetical protein